MTTSNSVTCEICDQPEHANNPLDHIEHGGGLPGHHHEHRYPSPTCNAEMIA